MFVRDVISLRILAVAALGVALLFTSVRAAHCERSRDLLATSMATELTDDGAPPPDAPLSHAPADDGAARDRACTSTAALVPARLSTGVPPESTTDASYVARAFRPRRTGISLERPPRCC